MRRDIITCDFQGSSTCLKETEVPRSGEIPDDWFSFVIRGTPIDMCRSCFKHACSADSPLLSVEHFKKDATKRG